MLLDLERHIERSIFHQAKQGILRLGLSAEQIHRFGKYRFTYEQRGLHLLDALDRPAMVALGPIEEGDERACVNDGEHCAGQSPRDALGWLPDRQYLSRPRHGLAS